MFTNFTSFNTPAWMKLDGITTATLDQIPMDAGVEFAAGYPGLIQPGGLTYATRIVVLPYVDDAEAKASIEFGLIPNVQGLFTSASLVAGGWRLYKTSASTQESGVIKAVYIDRGMIIQKGLQ